MKRLFKFKYPKITILILITIFSIYLFRNPTTQSLLYSLEKYPYISIFITGFLFSFGFLTPLAIGFFLTFPISNIFMASIVAGIGGALSDLLIFKLIRLSFMDEFLRLEKTKPLRELAHAFKYKPLHKFKAYVLYISAGIIIASPLPDELGVTMLAGLSAIKPRLLAILSFIVKTIGIYLMLLLAQS